MRSDKGFPREGRDTFEVNRLLEREIDIINIFISIHIDQYIYRSMHTDLQTKRLRERESERERRKRHTTPALLLYHNINIPVLLGEGRPLV